MDEIVATPGVLAPAALPPEAEDELLLLAIRRLNGTILGLTLGAVAGLVLFVATLWLVATFAFGSVMFFSAVQGKVWYTAHVVGVALALVYAWASIEAKRPLVAGLALGAAALTRTPMAFMFPLFMPPGVTIADNEILFELIGTSCIPDMSGTPADAVVSTLAPGSTAVFYLRGNRRGGSALFALGASDRQMGGVPLPYDLAPLGAPT